MIDPPCGRGRKLLLLDPRQLHHLALPVRLADWHAAEFAGIAVQRDRAELGDTGLDLSLRQGRVDLTIKEIDGLFSTTKVWPSRPDRR